MMRRVLLLIALVALTSCGEDVDEATRCVYVGYEQEND